MKFQKTKLKIYIASISCILLVTILSCFFIRRNSILKINSIQELSQNEKIIFDKIIQDYRNSKLNLIIIAINF